MLDDGAPGGLGGLDDGEGAGFFGRGPRGCGADGFGHRCVALSSLGCASLDAGRLQEGRG